MPNTKESRELQAGFAAYRRARAEELADAVVLLQRAQVLNDPGPLTAARAQCFAPPRTAGPAEPDAGKAYWGYEVTALRVDLEPLRHYRPRGAETDGLAGFLTVTAHEYVPERPQDVGRGYDLLRRLDAKFHFDAYHQVGDSVEDLRAAWHLDTHLHTATESREAHPRFHFQVGGEQLDDVDARIRGVLMPEAPRVPCAPLDAILAVDFVLAHYCGARWRKLRDDEPQFARLRKLPMQRYWGPYFRTVADGIDALDDAPDGGAACTLMPSVFCG